MTHIDTLKQALKPLEEMIDLMDGTEVYRNPTFSHCFNSCVQSLAALRLVIEQAEKQEPVAVPGFIRQRLEREIESATNPKGMSVHDGRTRALAADIAYLLKVIDTALPPRQPLTDDETMQLLNETCGAHWADEAHIQRFRRAIEVKHGIR